LLQESHKVGSFLKRHFIAWWASFAGVLAAGYLLYKVGSPIGDALTAWLVRHESTLGGSINIDGTATFCLAAVALLLAALIVFGIFTTALLLGAQRQANLAQQTPILAKTFDRSVQAADLIAKQLFPGAASAVKQVVRCKQVYTLYKNGDCQATETLVVTANDRDIHFMEKLIAADIEGDPVDFPDDKNLNLISGNEKRQKNVVVFFLPRIQATNPEQREITITYYWKGFFRRLIIRGEEPFVTTIKSVADIPLVEYEFWVAPDAGVLSCINVGQLIDEEDAEREKLEQVDVDERGMRGMEIPCSRLPLGSHEPVSAYLGEAALAVFV
jgi:hypothetical protein